jgi:3'-5' exoribonuclease
MNPENPSQSEVETVRKVYVKDLREKQPVHTVFRVTQKQKISARSGKVFLAVTLADRTGEVDARVFDQVEAAEALFQAGDHLLVRGEVISFHGKSQVVIHALEKLDPEPLDPKEFTPPPAPAPAPPRPDRPSSASRSPVAAPARSRRSASWSSESMIRT